MSRNQYWKISDLAKYCNQFALTQNDRFIAISGNEGQGKSILSGLATKELFKLRRCDFQWKNVLFYARKKLQKQLEDTTDGVFIDDEAVREFNRTFYKKEQIEYVKMTKTIRFHRHIVFKNIPYFWELDSGLRKRIGIYLYMKKKPMNGRPGIAQVFLREANAFVTDPWNLSENLKLARKGKIESSPNFHGIIIVPDYSEEDWFKGFLKEYEVIKEANRKAAYGEEAGDYIDIKTACQVVNMLKEVKAIKHGSGKDIANKLGISYGLFRYNLTNVKTFGNNNGGVEIATTEK